MIRHCCLERLFLSGCLCLTAQNLSKEEHDANLSKLTDEQKVDYIIANNYALYSADFDHGLALTKQATTMARKNLWKDKEAHCHLVLSVIYYLKVILKKASIALRKNDLKKALIDSKQNYRTGDHNIGAIA